MGHWECPGSQKIKHGHVAYQIDGDDEQNKIQVKISTLGQTGDLGVRSKGQISLNFGYHVNFKDLYTKLCFVFSQIKDRKHIEHNFHSVAWIMPHGRDLGVLECQKLYRGDLRWRPIDCAL